MSHHTYKHIELTGSSEKSIEDAVQNAVAKASETVKHMRWLEVTDTRGHIEDGRVAHWQVTVLHWSKRYLLFDGGWFTLAAVFIAAHTYTHYPVARRAGAYNGTDAQQ